LKANGVYLSGGAMFMIQSYIRKKDLIAKNAAKWFTKKVLGKTSPKCMCFAICYPLSLLLESKQIKSSIKNGPYFLTPTKFTHHYWLQLDHGKKLILDPTIRQFEKNSPVVYLGIQTEKYSERDFDLNKTLKSWREGFQKKDYKFEKGLSRELYESIVCKAEIILQKQRKRLFRAFKTKCLGPCLDEPKCRNKTPPLLVFR
jgi:hypothetical protein